MKEEALQGGACGDQGQAPGPDRERTLELRQVSPELFTQRAGDLDDVGVCPCEYRVGSTIDQRGERVGGGETVVDASERTNRLSRVLRCGSRDVD
jgi:hypothetical protein